MIGHLFNVTLTVYRGATTEDGRGGRTTAMASHGTIRAKVDQPSAAERMAAGQEGAKLSHVVRTRYGADVKRGDELDTGEPRRLRVVAVIHDSHRTYSRLECEVVQGG